MSADGIPGSEIDNADLSAELEAAFERWAELPTSTIDFVYHDYRQPHPEQRLFGTSLESGPQGTDGDVGREWDVIIGFEEIAGVDLEYVYAEFDPGAAFDERATRARFHKLSIVLTL